MVDWMQSVVGPRRVEGVRRDEADGPLVRRGRIVEIPAPVREGVVRPTQAWVLVASKNTAQGALHLVREATTRGLMVPPVQPETSN